MEKTIGYSIWSMPSVDVYNKLVNLITQLSKKYSSPNFEPHITLIGDLIESEKEIISKTSQLVSVLEPFPVRLTEVVSLEEYFQCLFIKVEESVEIMKANLEARKLFDRQNEPKYMPHLSLIYGKFSERIKQEIIGITGKKFDIGFDMSKIRLVNTDGTPKDWYKVKEFNLKSF